MSGNQFSPWHDMQNLFKLSCADAETCNQMTSMETPVPPLQRADTEISTRKMAIPRLAEGAESVFTSPGRFHRRHVRRACESCRQRKTKCTGDKSGCRNCREVGIICCYTDGKREKSKRQLASLSAKVQAYEDVIKKLSDRFGVSDEKLVNIALTAEPSSGLELSSDAGTGVGERKLSWTSASGLESSPTRASSVAPSELLDHTEEDFNRDETSRATGFIGKSSEITWLQNLSKEVTNEVEGWSASMSNSGYNNGLPSPKLTPHPENPSDPWLSSSNYYLDDLDIPAADPGDASEVPSCETATKLLNTYLTSVHPSFPIIGVSTFVSQFQVFFSQPTLNPGNKWLSILNLIFAIASKFGQLTDADWKEGEDDHEFYFGRARTLSLEGQFLRHSDLQQLQVEGLACFYMISSGHINRAWKLSGSAVRGALALGLHLRNLGSCTSDTSKEIRYRVWWSLYTIEHLLSVMTGRPSCIIDSSTTTPLPVPFDESEFQKDDVAHMISTAGRSLLSQVDRVPLSNSKIAANLDSSTDSDITETPTASDTKISRTEYLKSLPPCMSLYFLQLTSLTKIAKRMTVKLYGPEAQQSPWATTEFTIRSLMLDLDSWFMDLPTAYDFTSTQTSQCPLSQRMNLAFLFYSTKVGITRPCLCRLDPASAEGDKTHESCTKTATECVEAACHMLTLFPDTPDAAMLYNISPWWCTLHYLMQAATVLLLELAFHAQHVPERAMMVSKVAKKALDWLSTLSKTNIASKRAWKLCDGFLRRLAPHVGIDVSELSDNENDESSVTSFFGAPKTTDASQMVELDDVTFDPSAVLPIVTPTAGSVNADMDSIACSPMDQFGPPLEIPVSLEIEPDILEQFQKPETCESERSSYDDYFPYDPATGQMTGSFFPAGSNVDFDMGSYWNDPIY
ncbi:hypothetical protein N7495_002209 [Penicillium taxi]|uniref:uncharacterized protein n=1 Tax=Penicillium taxi TaxID=168475 RepID=UPI002545A5AF|nr:uncharacterized protein N7495_002209 [Penicillium taxi]KAJ5901681.1 hypothetical protein N7495_002209 [Penicillium taxi]